MSTCLCTHHSLCSSGLFPWHCSTTSPLLSISIQPQLVSWRCLYPVSQLTWFWVKCHTTCSRLCYRNSQLNLYWYISSGTSDTKPYCLPVKALEFESANVCQILIVTGNSRVYLLESAITSWFSAPGLCHWFWNVFAGLLSGSPSFLPFLWAKFRDEPSFIHPSKAPISRDEPVLCLKTT